MILSDKAILVVEDDPSVRQGLVDSLDYAGYRVISAARGDEARNLMLAMDLDLVLLDVVLPGADGFELLEELRRSRPRLPVIMVTARGAEGDRVRGLKNGADDYVVKPFSSTELLARVEAVLRRSAERPHDVRALTLDATRVDLERREIVRGDEVLQISAKETEILRYLATSSGRAISREELLQRVWGLDTRRLETRTVDMHVARLREKLGEEKGAPRFVQTLRGKGYLLGGDVRVEA